VIFKEKVKRKKGNSYQLNMVLRYLAWFDRLNSYLARDLID